MNPEQIIRHPDAYLAFTISHDGVASIVSDLESDDHLIAVDGSHHRYSKIYVLDLEDVNPEP
jgi:UDP-N-acetylglucosamine transferase subunit ALG13